MSTYSKFHKVIIKNTVLLQNIKLFQLHTLVSIFMKIQGIEDKNSNYNPRFVIIKWEIIGSIL